MITVKKKKKLPALDKYVIFSFTVLIIYSIAEFLVSTITGISHDVLTGFVYAAFGGELVMLCMIKRLKLKKGDTDNEMDS